MTVTPEVRAEYARLSVLADAAYEALKPHEAAYREACKPHEELLDRMSELIDGEDVLTCEGCQKPIFEGDKHTSGGDCIWMCEECSPNLSDVIKHQREAMAMSDFAWEEYGFDSVEEFKKNLTELEADLAANGDRNVAHP
jgi:hypothetical protein